MYYHLSDHIYITQFRDEMIFLDTKVDKYTICFKQFSDLLNDLLEGDHFDAGNKLSSSSGSRYSQVQASIQKLLDDNILERRSSPYPFHIDRKLTSDGVSNVDWRLPLENKKISFNLHIVNAFFILIKVNFYIKFKGFYQATQLIKNTYNPQLDYIIPSDAELKDLATIVNKACLLYPTRIKCLEWAMTYVLLALKRGWKCNLEAGVQNYPFLAHAWVECNEKVVMDDQNLRKGLAIILNEPFRRLRK